MKKRMRLFALVFGILGLVSCERNTPAGIVDYGNLLRQDTVSSYVPKSMVRNVKLDSVLTPPLVQFKSIVNFCFSNLIFI